MGRAPEPELAEKTNWGSSKFSSKWHHPWTLPGVSLSISTLERSSTAVPDCQWTLTTERMQRIWTNPLSAFYQSYALIRLLILQTISSCLGCKLRTVSCGATIVGRVGAPDFGSKVALSFVFFYSLDSCALVKSYVTSIWVMLSVTYSGYTNQSWKFPSEIHLSTIVGSFYFRWLEVELNGGNM